ncbi:MAG: hypothetical protein Q4P13_08105 [Psychrobacter sp.]|nr:hypothetical protein [Psychrobacter sp.]
MNGSDNKQLKKHDDLSCLCSDLLPAISRLIEQTTALIEQNTTLIEVIESKDQMVLTLVEQNAELIAQFTDEDEESDSSQYLDIDTSTF